MSSVNIQNALTTLNRHELLVQLVREREDLLLVEEGDYARDPRPGGFEIWKSRKVLDADAVAYLIEEVLELAGVGRGD